MPLALLALREEIEALASKIDAPRELLPTYVKSIDFAHPHLEWDEKGYHWIIVERGREIKRVTSKDPSDVLYHVFGTITFEMACAFSVKNRDHNEDFRRKLWSHQLDLLTKIEPLWAGRRKSEMQAILLQAPYRTNRDHH